MEKCQENHQKSIYQKLLSNFSVGLPHCHPLGLVWRWLAKQDRLWRLCWERCGAPVGGYLCIGCVCLHRAQERSFYSPGPTHWYARPLGAPGCLGRIHTSLRFSGFQRWISGEWCYFTRIVIICPFHSKSYEVTRNHKTIRSDLTRTELFFLAFDL